MTEITIVFQTDKTKIEPAFFDNLNNLAEQYGLFVQGEVKTDSVQLIREDREWLDQRDEERAILSKGLQKDLSHLDRMRSKR